MIVLNQKHSVIFFSAGVILMLLLIMVGVPIIPVAQQHTGDSVNEMQDDGKSKEDTIIQTKSIEDMDCSELNQFITSFEKGWGNAMTLYNENCS